MIRIALKMMRKNVRQLIPAGIAIIVGTAFLAATFLFGNSLDRSMRDQVSAAYGTANFIVEDNRYANEQTYATKEEAKAAAQEQENIDNPVLSDVIKQARNEKVASYRFDTSSVAVVTTQRTNKTVTSTMIPMGSDASIMPLKLVKGRYPTKPGEIALDQRRVAKQGWKLGDEVTYALQTWAGPDSASAQESYVKAKVVGFVSDPNHAFPLVASASVASQDDFVAASVESIMKLNIAGVVSTYQSLAQQKQQLEEQKANPEKFKNANEASLVTQNDVKETEGYYNDTVKETGMDFMQAQAWLAQYKAHEITPDANTYNTRDFSVNGLYLRAKDGVTTQQLAQIFPKKLWKVTTRSASEKKMMDNLGNGTDFVRIFLLTFGLLALFVAALVISNTFQVLVAQRRRTLALLRAIGAKKKQLYHMVEWEAVALGLVSSALGVGVACLIIFILDATNVTFGANEVQSGVQFFFIPSNLVFSVPMIAGTVITLIASLTAARLATKVTPLEALRPMDQIPTKKAGFLRAALSILLMLIGGALVAWVVYATNNDMVMKAKNINQMAMTVVGLAVLGCALLLVGLIISAIWWMPVLMKIGNAVASHVGPASRVAAANVSRNPRRVASTGVALLIGVTLVSTIATGAATVKTTMNSILDNKFSVDMSIVSSKLTASKVKSVRSVDGVEGAGLVYKTSAEVDKPALQDDSATVVSISAQERRDVIRGAAATASLPRGSALMSSDKVKKWGKRQLKSGDKITLTVDGDVQADGTVKKDQLTFTVKIVDFRLPDGARDTPVLLVNPEDLPQSVKVASNAQMWAKISENINIVQLMSDIPDAIGSGEAYVMGPGAERQLMNLIIDRMMISLIALLAVAVLIALVGVANTLSLSVIERTRESATLRAVGMTRGQLKRSLAVEALIISIVASLAGIILGTTFGGFGAWVVLQSAFGKTTLMINWTISAIIVVVALVAALISSVAPARRAIKTPPVEALAEA
ncbi:MAG TPA: FtsX-like permease family protein [Aeriscardovia aeriphila]|uniref:FtsX-like permease family protein n=1 Tax=Aeriscardovia aeriphila TaxID=218139 RepID=A0A921KBK8_9BIFI|nr:FtsX-like permease family protein [Aeriscardovia aeriphila]